MVAPVAGPGAGGKASGDPGAGSSGAARARLILALCALPGSVACADQGSATPLTWEACVAEAQERNPDLRAARFKLDAAGVRRSAQAGDWLPHAEASLTQQRGRSFPNPGDGSPGYAASLSASQSLFGGFATLTDSARAGVEYRKARNGFRRTEAEVRHDLRQAWAESLEAQDLDRLRETLAARRIENTRLVSERLAARHEDESFRLQAEAEAGKAAFEASRARRALARSRQRLARTMGRETATTFVLSGDWTAPPPPAAPDLAGLAEAVPSVVEAVADLELARLGEREARAAFWPAIDATGSVSRDGASFPPSETHGWSAGLSVSLNLFNRMKDRAAVRIARLEAGAAEAELAAARRDAVGTLEEALEPYENAYEAVDVRRKSAEAARARAANARDKYAAGGMDFDQWNEVESGLADAEVEYLDARKEALNAEAAWRKAVGTGFP